MDTDDPEKRIAELERQLAEAKAAARSQRTGAGQDDAEERGRRYAEALLEGLRTGGPAEPGGPSGPEMAELREALMRAAADAGMSQEQLDNALQHGTPTINVERRVVYSGPGIGSESTVSSGSGFARLSGAGPQRRTRVTANRVGSIVGMICGLIGICVGGSAALIAVFPVSALWMSPIVCDGPYELAYNASHYSYKPGQSGTSFTFQCVSGAGSYDVSEFAIIGLQALLAAFGVIGVALVVQLIRRARKP